MRGWTQLRKNIVRLCFFAYLLLFSFSCSDVNIKISTVHHQLVYDYSSKNAAPTVKLSIFAEISSGDNRIQTVTLRNTTNGMRWTVDPADVVSSNSSKKKYAGYSSFCMPGSLKFEKAVYQIIYEDKAGKTTDALITINQDDADKYASTALNKTDKQYLVMGKNGKILYTGAYDETLSSNEMIKQAYPDVDYYRQYVLNVDVNAIYLMPAVYIKSE